MIGLLNKDNNFIENLLLFLPRLLANLVLLVINFIGRTVGCLMFGDLKKVWNERHSSISLSVEVRLLGAIFWTRGIVHRMEIFSTSKKNYFSKGYLLVIATILFVVVLIKYFPALPNVSHYYASMNKDDIGRSTQSLYISEDRNSAKFGEAKTDENGQFIELANSPLSLVWKPSRFPLNREVTVSAEFEDSGDWDISLVCSRCKPSKKYDWHPFYRGELRSRQIVKTFGAINIYAKEKRANDAPSPSLKEYLSQTLQSGDPIKILDNSYPLSEIANTNIGFEENSKTTIKPELRGSHEFYLYLKDALLLESAVTLAPDSDESANIVVLSDVDGKEIERRAFAKAEPTVSSDRPQYFVDLNQAVGREGIYRVSFNIEDDAIINSITANTNKIVISSGVSLTGPAELYSEMRVPTIVDLSLNVRSASETTSFITELAKDSYDLDFRTDAVSATLPAGSYRVNSSGNQRIRGSFFSLSRDQYFTPFIYNTSDNSNPVFTISNVKVVKSRRGYSAEIVLDRKELLKVGSLRRVAIELENRALSKRFAQTEALRSENYFRAIHRDERELWSRSGNTTTVEASNSLENMLVNMLPDGAKIYAEDVVENYGDLLKSSPAGEFSTATNTIENISLRGSHQFYLYLENTLEAQIEKEDLNKYSGKDDVILKLLSGDGKPLCQSVVADDGNASDDQVSGKNDGLLQCNDLVSGVYILAIEEVPVDNISRSDFAISQIRVNTNRFITKELVLSIAPISLFSNSPNSTALDLFYWHEGKDQAIEVNHGEEIFELTKEDASQHKKFTLKSGAKNLTVPVGDLYILGGRFAFAPDQYFDPGEPSKINNGDWTNDNDYIFTQDDSNADFQLISSKYDARPYLRSFYVDVE